MSRIHMISIGGAAMHNIALALQKQGHKVSGSDDEIYNPSKTKLEKAGLLPDKMGWDTKRISKDIDFVILGMHAREDNQELIKARELGLKIYSYPEFIFNISKNKKRVVIAGSQGKTTTTSMIMWVLKKAMIDFDYLVGGNIKGFELMVKLSDAPVIVLEGDEYLSSPIDRRPKIHHYHPHIAVLTGIDWDHMNVFPTYKNYKQQFIHFIDMIEDGGDLIFYENDPKVLEVIEKSQNSKRINLLSYTKIDIEKAHNFKVFGAHNLSNLNAALLVCKQLGIEEKTFFDYISDFEGAAKRLQKIYEDKNTVKFLDFAHAPAKLKATIDAVRNQYPDRKLYAIYELHTYSSLNKDFLPQYSNTMDNADRAAVLFNPHTLKMKKMPELNKEEIALYFKKKDLDVFDSPDLLEKYIFELNPENAVFLFMSSGNFGNIKLF